jgi:hypothetical protein
MVAITRASVFCGGRPKGLTAVCNMGYRTYGAHREYLRLEWVGATIQASATDVPFVYLPKSAQRSVSGAVDILGYLAHAFRRRCAQWWRWGSSYVPEWRYASVKPCRTP